MWAVASLLLFELHIALLLPWQSCHTCETLEATSAWFFDYLHFHLFLPSEESKSLKIQMLQKFKRSVRASSITAKMFLHSTHWNIRAKSVRNWLVGTWQFSLVWLASILDFPPNSASPSTHLPHFFYFMTWIFAQRKVTVQWLHRKKA